MPVKQYHPTNTGDPEQHNAATSAHETRQSTRLSSSSVLAAATRNDRRDRSPTSSPIRKSARLANEALETPNLDVSAGTSHGVASGTRSAHSNRIDSANEDRATETKIQAGESSSSGKQNVLQKLNSAPSSSASSQRRKSRSTRSTSARGSMAAPHNPSPSPRKSPQRRSGRLTQSTSQQIPIKPVVNSSSSPSPSISPEWRNGRSKQSTSQQSKRRNGRLNHLNSADPIPSNSLSQTASSSGKKRTRGTNNTVTDDELSNDGSSHLDKGDSDDDMGDFDEKAKSVKGGRVFDAQKTAYLLTVYEECTKPSHEKCLEIARRFNKKDGGNITWKQVKNWFSTRRKGPDTARECKLRWLASKGGISEDTYLQLNGVLEQVFKEDMFPDVSAMKELAKSHNLPVKTIIQWYNRKRFEVVKQNRPDHAELRLKVRQLECAMQLVNFLEPAVLMECFKSFKIDQELIMREARPEDLRERMEELKRSQEALEEYERLKLSAFELNDSEKITLVDTSFPNNSQHNPWEMRRIEDAVRGGNEEGGEMDHAHFTEMEHGAGAIHERMERKQTDEMAEEENDEHVDVENGGNGDDENGGYPPDLTEERWLLNGPPIHDELIRHDVGMGEQADMPIIYANDMNDVAHEEVVCAESEGDRSNGDSGDDDDEEEENDKNDGHEEEVGVEEEGHQGEVAME